MLLRNVAHQTGIEPAHPILEIGALPIELLVCLVAQGGLEPP
jgi:hypothetical protein